MGTPTQTDTYHSRQPSVYWTATFSEKEKLEFAIKNGTKTLSIFIEPEENISSFPRNRPMELKNELDSKLPNNKIDNIRFTRKGSLLINTTDINTASMAIDIKDLLGINAVSRTIKDQLTSKFLLKGIDPGVNLLDVQREIELRNNVKVLELTRFCRRDQLRTPTFTILVTSLGHYIPSQIDVWYQLYNIESFVDKPRQCQRCFKFNHVAKFCKSNQLCKNCSQDFNGDTNHLNGQCPFQKKCVNCSGNHDNADKNCITYNNELLICKLKADKHISNTEARRLFYGKKDSNSYGKIASASPQSEYIIKKEFANAMQELVEAVKLSMK